MRLDYAICAKLFFPGVDIGTVVVELDYGITRDDLGTRITLVLSNRSGRNGHTIQATIQEQLESRSGIRQNLFVVTRKVIGVRVIVRSVLLEGNQLVGLPFLQGIYTSRKDRISILAPKVDSGSIGSSLASIGSQILEEFLGDR